jgi:hypothetical protein
MFPSPPEIKNKLNTLWCPLNGIVLVLGVLCCEFIKL